MASIFSKIIEGSIPAYKIAEDDNFLAFLDVFPLREGHALVIPKKEVDYIFDLEDDLYQGLWLFAKKVAHAIGKAIPCEKVGTAVVGLEVPHAHIHLIPMDKVSDMDFSQSKKQFEKAEFEATLAKIKTKL
jgi:histidine triad (HIT) family protein